MYPYDIILDIGLYELCIIIGIIAAMVLFRVLADKDGLSAKMQNSVLLGIPLALFIGYPSAVVVQWLYNGIRDGEFSADVFASTTGSTFYGGLIGGSAAFLIYYFLCGRFYLKSKEHIRRLSSIFEIGPACIAIGHAFGRIGCFFAGCCYGVRTDSVFGVFLKNPAIPYKVLPVQLFEAGFLFLLCAFMTVRFVEKKRYNLPIYLTVYGVWRFAIEYLRGDDRGETFVTFLSPSQLTAVVLILLGVALIFLFRVTIYRKNGSADADAVTSESGEDADGIREESAAPSEPSEQTESGDGK